MDPRNLVPGDRALMTASLGPVTALRGSARGDAAERAKRKNSRKARAAAAPSPGLGSPSPDRHANVPALLPAHLEGPWLLDADDIEMDELIAEDRYAELYRARYRKEHLVVVGCRVRRRFFVSPHHLSHRPRSW